MTPHNIPKAVERPAHVPPDLVHDLDFFNLEGAGEGVQEAWLQLKGKAPPIFWTPRNGGHWVATRGADIEEIQRDHAHFSMRNSLIPNIPRPYPAHPIDLDPPQHAPWRLLISPAFSPKAVAAVEQEVRDTTIRLIEGLRARGECEFMGDFAKVLPIVVFLSMMGLPLEDRHELMPHADAIVRSPDPAKVMAARMSLMAYVQKAVDQRRETPTDDLLTTLMNATVNGQSVEEKKVVGMGALLLSGGLDTVKNMLGFVVRFLAMHPEHAQQLRDDPALIPNAVEELIRRHGISNTGRVIVEDYVFRDVQLKGGESIQVPTSLVGLDDTFTPDPLEVDFKRTGIHHAAFGNGPHKCPGAILARRELRIFLEEWMTRVPPFHLKPGAPPRMSSGMVNQLMELWICWDSQAAVALKKQQV